jgi:hypothetical protein
MSVRRSMNASASSTPATGVVGSARSSPSGVARSERLPHTNAPITQERVQT